MVGFIQPPSTKSLDTKAVGSPSMFRCLYSSLISCEFVDEDLTYGLGSDQDCTQFIVDNAGEAIRVKHILKAYLKCSGLH